ncbi:DNA methylase containing a Zn-ribbon module [Pyrococcus sp. NA2]|uniref:DUF1156 domain-containing protein n=1 Tax=Pyrococcus sp. (strain NA2) TaxID=342949 RepID=UPI000209A932|nr:DUF1156 domain-containing protein [Pyrococcus sp. NA2]AEC52476.1 DNA methylase containing a Zn-ribbon module [Pyrococcus sp. NA2]
MKKLIIEEFLPIEEINKEAKTEKLGNAKPPISSIHYYWTGKPLITARAVAIGSLIGIDEMPWKIDPKAYDDLEKARYANFVELLKLNKEKRAHNYDPDRGLLLKAIKKTWGEVPEVLDPFAGAGSIPFEVLRVGTSVVANDYNPVAYLILKATLEYPKKYGWKLYEDVKRYANQILNELKEELGHLYPKHNGKDVAAYIYSWVVKCPYCGFKTPLVGSWQLSTEKRNKKGEVTREAHYIDYKIQEDKIKFEIKKGKAPQSGNVSDGVFTCLKCGAQISDDYVAEYIRKHEEEVMMAVVLLEKRGKSYDVPSEDDIKAFEEAKRELKRNWLRFYREGLIPDEHIPEDSRTTWAYEYLPRYYQLFNPRQLLLMLKYAEKAKKIVEEIAKEDEEYAKAVGVYLSFILAKHIDRNCRATTWDSYNQQVSHMFAQRGIAMMWNHLEVNPFVKSSGALQGMIDNVLNGLKYAIEKLSGTEGNVKIHNESILRFNPGQKFKVIITDPPYYDDVPYGEVSEVFYVWHRRIVGWLFEKESRLFKNRKVETKEEIDVGGNRDKEHFNRLFTEALKKLHELLYDDGVLVLFFAHKSSEAWHFVLEALRKAGFVITATYPIHTESTESSVARGKRSIYHSLIIVTRKRKEDKTGFIEDLMDEIERKVEEKAKKLEGYGLKGSDLLVASTGAVLEVLTQYSELKSYSGKASTADAVELAMKFLARYVAKRVTGLDNVDEITTFYLYLRLNGMDEVDYSTANQLMKSLGIDERLLEKKKLIRYSSEEKGSKKVILENFYRGDSDLEFKGEDPLEATTLIDYVHKVMRAFVRNGIKGLKDVLKEAPYPEGSIIKVLEALASIRLDPKRENDEEAKIAHEILTHLRNLGFIGERGERQTDIERWVK